MGSMAYYIGRSVTPYPKPTYHHAGERFRPHVALSNLGTQHVDTH